jgi:hypothetical protein
MPTLAELQAEEARTKRELQDAIAQLVEEVGDEDAQRIMQAVDDGLALGFADAAVEANPNENFWKPGEKNGRRG